MSKALVVDDSKAIRMILAGLLGECGYQVSQAPNGKEALAMLGRNNDVGLVLVDWNMPEMNGYDFVRVVRANPAWADVKLMMVTTETEVEQMVKALEAGANEFVMKPFTREIVEDKLRLIGAID